MPPQQSRPCTPPSWPDDLDHGPDAKTGKAGRYERDFRAPRTIRGVLSVRGIDAKRNLAHAGEPERQALHPPDGRHGQRCHGRPLRMKMKRLAKMLVVLGLLLVGSVDTARALTIAGSSTGCFDCTTAGPFSSPASLGFLIFSGTNFSVMTDGTGSAT